MNDRIISKNLRIITNTLSVLTIIAFLLVSTFSGIAWAQTAVPLTEVWVDDSWISNSSGDIVGPGLLFGYNAFSDINWAIENVSSGGTIHVADGEYSENVNIYKPVSILGANYQGYDSFVSSSIEETLIDGIIKITSSDVFINGVTIDVPADFASDHGIYVTSNELVGATIAGDLTNIVIQNCNIYTLEGYGIYFDQVSSSSILYNFLYNDDISPYGIYSEGDGVNITGNYLEDFNNGIFSFGDNCIIDSNGIYCGEGDTSIFSSGEYVSIENNYVDYYNTGIVSTGNDSTIANNEIYSYYGGYEETVGDAGYEYYGIASEGDNANIAFNDVYYFSVGIYNLGNGSFINDNYVEGDEYDPYGIISEGDSVSIGDNTVLYYYMEGIDSFGTGCSITGNSVAYDDNSWGFVGIYSGGDSVELSMNYVQNYWAYGIYCYGDGVVINDNTVEDVYEEGDDDWGIVARGDFVTINDNTVRNNFFGIYTYCNETEIGDNNILYDEGSLPSTVFAGLAADRDRFDITANIPAGMNLASASLVGDFDEGDYVEIGILSYGDLVNIHDNQITDLYNGIVTFGDDCDVSYNVIETVFGENGIYSEGNAIEFLSNSIYGYVFGITSTGDDCTFTDNDVYRYNEYIDDPVFDQGLVGCYITEHGICSNGDSAVITGNDVYDYFLEGIFARGDGCEITDNYLMTEYGETGITADGFSIIVTGNTITGFTKGIFSAGDYNIIAANTISYYGSELDAMVGLGEYDSCAIDYDGDFGIIEENTIEYMRCAIDYWGKYGTVRNNMITAYPGFYYYIWNSDIAYFGDFGIIEGNVIDYGFEEPPLPPVSPAEGEYGADYGQTGLAFGDISYIGYAGYIQDNVLNTEYPTLLGVFYLGNTGSIVNNTIENPIAGVIYAGSTGTVSENNILNENQGGIGIGHLGYYATIENNEINNTAMGILYVNSIISVLTDVLSEDNILYGGDIEDIFLNSAEYLGYEIDDGLLSAANTVEFSDPGFSGHINGNCINNSENYGVNWGIVYYGYTGTINCNEIYGSEWSMKGITAVSDNLTIAGNTIEGIGYYEKGLPTATLESDMYGIGPLCEGIAISVYPVTRNFEDGNAYIYDNYLRDNEIQLMFWSDEILGQGDGSTGKIDLATLEQIFATNDLDARRVYITDSEGNLKVESPLDLQKFIIDPLGICEFILGGYDPEDFDDVGLIFVRTFIQDAVDAANESSDMYGQPLLSDTVNLKPATYDECLFILKSVNIVGTEESGTGEPLAIIRSSGPKGLPESVGYTYVHGFPIIDVVSWSMYPTFANIANVQIDGSGMIDSEFVPFSGIFYDKGTNGTLSDNMFVNFGPFGDASEAYGNAMVGEYGQVGYAVVLSNHEGSQYYMNDNTFTEVQGALLNYGELDYVLTNTTFFENGNVITGDKYFVYVDTYGNYRIDGQLTGDPDYLNYVICMVGGNDMWQTAIPNEKYEIAMGAGKYYMSTPMVNPYNTVTLVGPDDWVYIFVPDGQPENIIAGYNVSFGVGTCEYDLVYEWNLISVPFELEDNNIENFFPPEVKANIESVWRYDDDGLWYLYKPDGDYTGWDFLGTDPLSTIEPGIGYYVNMTDGASFTVSGIIPADSPLGSCSINDQWNCIGITGIDSYDAATLFGDADSIESVWTYDSGYWYLYKPDGDYTGWDFLGTDPLSTIEPGIGYWVELKEQ
ncbi:hypothetical protein CUJ83_10140 [Methanocella sp. CWC-04]|uniref:Right handed beta helix domain-containing protein n=1 Tax=Methanooceanicella nereidis TaxID=2052831 RepID=A0AAP2RDL1_9EURY|nr:right-handed parallel beta-helix repeat-containing protein [Methanocella sp. CWC-04]MCD1295358.1 hypothetical protein [Methanocella sp. CWC-04]